MVKTQEGLFIELKNSALFFVVFNFEFIKSIASIEIIRNLAPDVTNFYILHEGLIGVFDDQLVEEDYDDIEEKKYSKNAQSGWLGITDKYWLTSLIPEKYHQKNLEVPLENFQKFNLDLNKQLLGR